MFTTLACLICWAVDGDDGSANVADSDLSVPVRPPAPVTITRAYKISNTTTHTSCVSGDCENGSGVSVDPSGRYEGGFLARMKHGWGTFKFSNNDTYLGEYMDDNRHGLGTFTFADGESFERVFVNGKETEPMLRPGTCNGDCENGQGVYIYENGDRYDGGWANGLKEGAGVYTFRQAAGHYDGQWKKGVKHGSGTFHYGADGNEFYTGQWQGGKQDGAGLFRFASGGQYEGGWEHGREHGLGTYTFPDGEAFERTWVHGRETERMVQAKQQQQQQQLASGAAGLGLHTDL